MAAATRVANWINLWQPTVMLQDPSVFCIGQKDKVNGDVVRILTPKFFKL